MTFLIRKSEERGQNQLNWLKSYHTFSFANYYDPKQMGFHHLRVINEDWIAPSKGFGMHPHRDMEIITYVLDGALEHKDSMGNQSTIKPGEVQVMSAGTGVLHSEYNPSSTESVHLLQIWILADRNGVTPRYDQRVFSDEEKHNRWRLIVSKNGEQDSLWIHQNANIYATILDPGVKLTYPFKPDRRAWLHVVKVEIILDGQSLKTGDGVAIARSETMEFEAKTEAELLLFDLM
jgi:redox-sensitive bicupin YhaK (pirin superfamily)